MPRRSRASSSSASSTPSGEDSSVLTKEPPVAADDPATAESEQASAATAATEEAPATESEQEGPSNDAEEPEIQVSFVQLGSADEAPISLPAGATVADLLKELGLSAKNGSVLVNSQHAGLEDRLSTGATVVFATNIKGGQF